MYKMNIADVDVPSSIFEALDDNKLVVFAGAGISMGKPACLPNFEQLSDEIASRCGVERKKEELIDQFLGRLKKDKKEVHSITKDILSEGSSGPTKLHKNILNFFRDDQKIRLVTTNFDILFQAAAKCIEKEPKVYCAPALPLGRNFDGVVHVHGSLDNIEELILTDEDFGRAYLSDGWARRFLLEMFNKYTVLFIGYSHNDTIVNYLSRTLPPGTENKRYVLISDKTESDHWKHLGIQTLEYKYTKNHSNLNEFVKELAVFHAGRLKSWKIKIESIVDTIFHIDDDTLNENIDLILSTSDNTRFFINKASHIEWVNAFNESGRLSPLFKYEALDSQYKAIANWLAKKFSCNDHAENLFKMIIQHKFCLHPDFGEKIVDTLIDSKKDVIDSNLLNRWVSILLRTIPINLIHESVRESYLLKLGKLCSKHEANMELLQIFDLAAENCVELVLRRTTSRDIITINETKIEVKCPMAGYRFALKGLWNDCVEPIVGKIAEPLLYLAVDKLNSIHNFLQIWDGANSEYDRMSIARSAIELHEQDENRRAHDILIDAARDSLEWIAENQPEVSKYWCSKHINSDVPVFRRLAIHTTIESSKLTSEEKLDWIFKYVDIFDKAVRHEIFRSFAYLYVSSSNEVRSQLVEFIWKHYKNNFSNYEKSIIFNLVIWMYNTVPSCNIASEYKNKIFDVMPNFEPLEHADFIGYTSKVEESPSPWTVEELLSKSVKESVQDILSYRNKEIIWYGISNINSTISEVATRNIEWGIEFAEELIKTKEFTQDDEFICDLWNNIIFTWRNLTLNKSQYLKILKVVNHTVLSSHFSFETSILLCNIVKDKRLVESTDLLKLAVETASHLWDSLKHDEKREIPLNNEWLIMSVNHPAGNIALFWLIILSIQHSEQNSGTDVIDRLCDSELSKIGQDNTLIGLLAKSFMASRYSSFLQYKPHWTREYILPLFSYTNCDSKFYLAWDGFLTRGDLDSEIANDLEKAFLKAIPKIASETYNQQSRFIEYCIVMITYYAKDPFTDWIPKIINSDIKFRYNFALVIEERLRNINDNQHKEWWNSWLKKYWTNRLNGIPKKLCDKEIQAMVDWLPYLGDAFPEAVKLIKKSLPVVLEDVRIFYSLEDSTIPDSFPNELAQLLVSLGDCELEKFIWNGKGCDLIDKMVQANIDDNLKNKLENLKLKVEC